MVVDIILSFIGWILMYFGLCGLDKIHYETNCNFWYIKPEKWADNFGLTWLITFFVVLAFI